MPATIRSFQIALTESQRQSLGMRAEGGDPLACSSGFANGDGAVGGGLCVRACMWISGCRDEACFVAVQRGQESWDFLESLGSASLGSVACLYRRSGDRAHNLVQRQGPTRDPPSLSAPRMEPLAPVAVMARPGPFLGASPESTTCLTALTAGRLVLPCSWSMRPVICSKRSLSNCLLACDSLPQEALGRPLRLRALDARSAGHRRRRRRRAKHSSLSC